MVFQGGKRMMAGGAEKCGRDSGRVRSGESGGHFLAILVSGSDNFCHFSLINCLKENFL